MKPEFSRQIFQKKPQVSNFMKIPPVENELLHADRQTDMTKLIVVFSYFANVPKNNRQKESLENTYTKTDRKFQ